MSGYGEQYYFIRADKLNDTVPLLKADDTTSMRDYQTEALPLGAPLVFTNGFRERNKQEGVKEQVSDVLFEGANIVVKKSIREKLLNLELENLRLYPAIYIDDEDHWHEDYWYVTFISKFDCWDRQKSTYRSTPLELGGETLYQVRKYELDDKVLNETPLRSRLLFKMGGAMPALVTAHQSVLKVFRGGNLTGVKFSLVSDT